MILTKIKETIFREYDIRGIWNEDITEDVAYTLGRSFASYISLRKEHEVIIGHDNRISSPIIHDALIQGLTESGAEVIDLGLVTTPMYYYAKKKNKIKNGIMITASHNPKEYNGFKISFDYRGNSCGQEIIDFRDYTNTLKFESSIGHVKTLNIRPEYLKEVEKSIDLGKRKVKVVFDCGNGTGSIIVKDMLDLFDCEYELLYCDSNPEFPNHHPDPCVPSNLKDLGNKVKELGYDLGIGIDGDADRVGLVDENGNYIAADLLMLIVYRSLSNNLKKRKAIYDVKCSKTLIDGLADLNIESEMYRTGNSYMNIKINEEDVDFGGEYSGHVWFRDKWPGFDDGLYAGLRLVEIVSKTDKKVSELLDNTNKYYSTEELKFTAPDEIKFEIVEKIKKYCHNKGYEMITVDGVRVTFDDSWALVRCSNTGPNITARFEAKTEKRLEEIKSEFVNLINNYLQ